MTRKLTDEEQFNFGFHDIPTPDERKKMSAEDLAIVLSKVDGRKAAHILIEHELQLRLAKEQSGATWMAAGLGFIGALLAAVLGAWSTGAFQPQIQTQRCECEWHARELRPQQNLDVKPQPSIAPEVTGISIKPPAASSPGIQPAQAGEAESNPYR